MRKWKALEFWSHKDLDLSSDSGSWQLSYFWCSFPIWCHWDPAPWESGITRLGQSQTRERRLTSSSQILVTGSGSSSVWWRDALGQGCLFSWAPGGLSWALFFLQVPWGPASLSTEWKTEMLPALGHLAGSVKEWKSSWSGGGGHPWVWVPCGVERLLKYNLKKEKEVLPVLESSPTEQDWGWELLGSAPDFHREQRSGLTRVLSLFPHAYPRVGKTSVLVMAWWVKRSELQFSNLEKGG